MSAALEGKRALVTGAVRGIGRAIAAALAAQGARVAVHARNLDKLAETVRAVEDAGEGAGEGAGGRAVPVAADLEDGAAISAMCEAAIAALGGIDIVVHNAGVAPRATLAAMDEALWDRVMAVNMRAPFLVAKYTMPAMAAQGGGGAQIFISSTAAKQGTAQQTAYNASKTGLVGFVRCLAAEVGPLGVTANTVCPGWTATEMASELYQGMAREAGRPFAEVYDEGMRANAMGAIVTPEDVAALVTYLAGPGARHITGQAINLCAGQAWS